MNYELYDFLPYYEPVSSPGFDSDMNSLKEFADYALPATEPFPERPGELMMHQHLIARFMNPLTPYDGLLLVHEMGTGKSCTAIAVAEKFIEYLSSPESASAIRPSLRRVSSVRERSGYSIAKKIIVLTRGEGLQTNFIEEVANVCTPGQYKSTQKRKSAVVNEDKQTRKNVKEKYTFSTFEVFAKKLFRMSDPQKHAEFENTLFIVDEAHNLRSSEKSSDGVFDGELKKVYVEFYKLFSMLKRRRVLLLTGTPMKDQPEEIVDLLNLIVPEKLSYVDLNNLETGEFARKIVGRVSYLKGMTSNVEKVNVGETLGTLTNLKVYPVQMSSFQTSIYLKACEYDRTANSVFLAPRQASALVFPDGSYGKAGFDKNVVRTSKSTYAFRDDVRRQLKKDLHRYSAKYANLLERLDADHANKRLAFVFSEQVKGSGLIVLALVLELFGYTRISTASAARSKVGDRSPRRFALFTNETTTSAKIKDIVNLFNSPQNSGGEHISLILGSKVIMEGYTFKNIQSEYILTPHWNYSETSQIIARGLRVGSHEVLLSKGVEPVVKVYHYAAVTDEKEAEPSIDVRMYQIAEAKDLRLQKVMRFLKEHSLDCSLAKARNSATFAADYSRECEYASCKYTCVSRQVSIGVDERNFRLMYFSNSKKFKELVDIITSRVLLSVTTAQELFETANERADREYSMFDVYYACHMLISSKTILFSSPIGVYYLFFSDGIFFAGLRAEKREDAYFDDYYRQSTHVFVGSSMKELVAENQSQFMTDLIKSIFVAPNIETVKQLMAKLPLYLQERLILYSTLAGNRNHQTRPPNVEFARQMILSNFRLYYYDNDPHASNSESTPPGGETRLVYIWLDPQNYKCYSGKRREAQLRVCSDQQKKEINIVRKKASAAVNINNPYKYIGLVNKVRNEFCLKLMEGDTSADKRRKRVGKRCQNWSKRELTDLIANRLRVNPSVDFYYSTADIAKEQNPEILSLFLENTEANFEHNKRIAFWFSQNINFMCLTIQETLQARNLVLEDPNCGTSKKIR